MISYDARPLIKITPPPSSSDRRVRTYHFAEAVKRLPCTWPEADVVPILRRINPELLGQVRALFVVLSDDQFRQVLAQLKRSKPQANAQAQDEGAMDTEVSLSDGFVTQKSGRGKSVKRGASSASGGPSAKK